MADADDQGDPLIGQILEDGVQLLSHSGVESGKGVVQQKQARLAEQGVSQQSATHFAVGELQQQVVPYGGEVKEGDDVLLVFFKSSTGGSFGWAYFKRVYVVDIVKREEVGEVEGGGAVGGVPAGLKPAVSGVGLLLCKRDQSDAVFIGWGEVDGESG